MYTRTKRWIAAVVLGAGLTTVSVACQSHPDGAAQKQHAQEWAVNNYAAISSAEQAAAAGDLTGAYQAFQSIPVPPVDPADWNRAVHDLKAATDDQNTGDLTQGIEDADHFSDDVTAWLTQFEKAAPDAVNSND